MKYIEHEFGIEDPNGILMENTELEVAIYDLKTENAKLRKDKERLDWMLNNYEVTWDDGSRITRDDIDAEMKEKYEVPDSK